MAGLAYGMDLGTNNIKIYNRAADNILVERNMIAIANKTSVFAYGDSAYEMYEKAPVNINISFPLVNGVIADLSNMTTLVQYFLDDITGGNIKGAEYFVAVPTDITDVEKRAFYDLVREANVKAKKVYIVEKAVAAGLGMDIDVKTSQGTLLVDVGFDTTEISLISLGGIVLSRLIKVGGHKFDESIRSAVRRELNLIIGAKTAETIKNNLAELTESEEGAMIYGRDVVSGLPVEREIPTKLCDECLVDDFSIIIDNIRMILETTPPELSADIYRNGLYLTGGASQVSKLGELISTSTGLTVNLAENPIASVAIGLSRIIKEDNYRNLGYSIEAGE